MSDMCPLLECPEVFTRADALYELVEGMLIERLPGAEIHHAGSTAARFHASVARPGRPERISATLIRSVRRHMKPITIRPAANDDAEQIANLTAELGYAASRRDIEARLDMLLPREDYFITVAEAAGQVIGWVAAELRTLLEFEQRVEIVGLVVASGHRRCGIGKALVSAVDAWRADRGIATIFVRSNIVRSESHPFYESMGYTRYKTQHAYIKHVVQ